jgi:hypothetical protein
MPDASLRRTAALLLLLAAVPAAHAGLLDAPTNLHAAYDPAAATVRLAWDAPASAVAFDVYRDGQLVAAAVPGPAYADAVPGAGTYAYVVTALDADGAQSAPSNAALASAAPVPWSAVGLPGVRSGYDATALDRAMCSAVVLGGIPPWPAINWDCLPPLPPV